ncbi:MAG: hypothetical protein ACKPKO_23080, partial [Candidatus Fonsibacter sp.]
MSQIVKAQQVQNQRATTTGAEPFIDELCHDYVVIDTRLVLDILHVVLVSLQAHVVVLQSVQPMHNMGSARIDIAVAV